MPGEIYWNAIEKLNGGKINWNAKVNSLECQGKSTGIPEKSTRMSKNKNTVIPENCSGMSGKVIVL